MSGTPAGQPRPLALAAEAARSARATLVPTLMILVLAGSMCVLTLITASRSAGSRADILARLDQAGSRELAISDSTDADLLTPQMVAVMNTVTTVETTIGLSVPYDAVNSAVGAGGNPVPAWILTGPLDSAIIITSGRAPLPGEAVVSDTARRALGMIEPFGAVVSRDALDSEGPQSAVAIVGSFTPKEPFTELASGVVIRPSTPAQVQTIRTVVRSAQDVNATLPVIVGIATSGTTGGLTVTSPASLADLQLEISADLNRSSRSLIVLVNTAAALLLAVVVLADILLRRKDLGRRRALGAPRWAIVVLVVLRSVVPALLGSVTGCIVASIPVFRSGPSPTPVLLTATVVLTVTVTIAASIGPAIFGATRDPVRVLRTA